MKITAKDVLGVEVTCMGDPYFHTLGPDAPRPGGGTNKFCILTVSTDGNRLHAVCSNIKYENYKILTRLYPDLEMSIEGNTMSILDSRIGSEWLC